MSARASETRWDFSPVYDLINSLSHQYEPAHLDQEKNGILQSQPVAAGVDKAVSFDGLGNLNKVWDFLGVTRDCPSPSIATFEASTQKAAGDAYASDGALNYPPSSKRTKWHDSGESTDHAETQEDEANKKLTKTQRKKANRQARKRAAKSEANAQLERDIQLVIGASDQVTEVDISAMSDSNKESWRKRTETGRDVIDKSNFFDGNKKAAKYEIPEKNGLVLDLTTTTKNSGLDWHHTLLKRDRKTEEVESEVEGNSNKPNSLPHEELMPISKSTYEWRKHLKKPSANIPIELRPAQIAPEHVKQKPLLKSEVTALAINAVQDSLKKEWPAPSLFTVQSQVHSSPGRRLHQILPLQQSTSVDRNWSLLNKLLRNFPEDRNFLLSPLQLSINRPQPNGIHVFVDASNIIIGFHEHLKLARGIPINTHVGRIDLAFHSLALLLERRRPIAKRVLAGSTPEIPAFEEARQVGYETNILDKVLKAKELTERQRKFASRDRIRQTAKGFSTGDDTDSPYNVNVATPKWVEQAVDEILHLKMMESIVDVAATEFAGDSGTIGTPQRRSSAPTMVLATGDAAEAEYSEGFMKQVERALKSGWNVEVAAWSTTISQAYRKWQKIGKERFKVIELDEYAEELFGQSEYPT